MSSIYHPASEPDADPSRIGGKAYALHCLASSGLEVPPWFVVTVDGVDAIARGDGADVSAAIVEALASSGLAQSLLAVRSSATIEDGSARSYAGQFESVLGVDAASVLDAVRHVAASVSTNRVASYRDADEREDPVDMAVIVQRMIDAEISGVAFGADPVSGDRETIVISATFGVGDRLVQGDVDGDTFTVRGGRITPTIAVKRTANRLDPHGGTAEVAVPNGRQREPALTPTQVDMIVRAVRKLGEHFGAPQDVEWAIAGGRLYILQSRPITSLATTSPDRTTGDTTFDERILWDNSNIVESYSGVTSPMTFSFVSDVYTRVYQEFCRIMGVDEETIARNRRVFSMLGYIDGRVYYNLLNWHRLLALLPGYRVNARFMEQMMGVRERLEDVPSVEPSRANPYLRLATSLFKLAANLFGLRSRIERFHALVDRELVPLADRDLGTLSPAELLRLYRHLESELLARWRVPIVNDFYTMIFHGLLRKSVGGIDGATPEMTNDLLAASGGIVSTEPMRLVGQLARVVRGDELLRSRLRSASDAEGLRLLQSTPSTRPILEEYIARFGDRTAGELKLETITARQRPEIVMAILRPYLDADTQSGTASASEEIERMLSRKLERHPLKRLLFRALLAQARTRVRERENLRFERTRVFGVVRRIMIALGEHLRAAGIIDEARDVFMLTKEEVFAAIEGTSTTRSYRTLVEARRSEARAFEKLDPADRFETIGLPLATASHTRQRASAAAGGATMRGLACSRGVVRAPVRVVRDPHNPGELAGHILVAERTDPGWGPLFPVALGLLVERGSLLSHSAIVAREMGIPAIVAIDGLLATLRDGEMVEMDGSTGEIRRIGNDSVEDA